jgi:hypothetical protein
MLRLRIVAAEDDGDGSSPLLDYVIRTGMPVKT